MSEEQLEALMSRPMMRQVSPGASRGARTWLASYRTGAMLSVVAALALAVGAWALWPASRAAASAPVAAEVPLNQLLPTGPAFSLVVASADGSDIALSLRRAREIGLPVFETSVRAPFEVRQAVVGPYASLDELARVRSQLVAIGLRSLGVSVDEASESSEVTIEGTGGAGSPVRLIGTHGRSSLVLDLTAEPRFVTSRRVSPSTFEVEVGPLARSIRPRQWRPPQGVHLIGGVRLEERAATASRNVVVSLDLPESVAASTRTGDRRLYVDIGSPFEQEVEHQIVVASGAVVGPTAPSEPDRRSEDSYRQGMELIRTRIAEVRPFVISAARSDSEDVSRAVDQTLAALLWSLEALSVPASEQPSHDRLLAAIREARRGLEPAFDGDRLAQAEQAADLFELELRPASTEAP